MTPFRLRHADTVAGALLLAAAGVVIVAAFLVMRSSALFEGRVHYHTIFKEGYGLTPGNAVTLLGIDVGRVQSVEITEGNRVRVGFDVRRSFAARVRADSKAEVKSPPGLGAFIGGTGIKLSVGSPAAPPVPPGGLIPGVDPIGVDEVMAFLQGENTALRARAAVQNVERLLAALGAEDGPVQSMLRDLAALTRDVREGRGAVGALWQDERLAPQLRASLAAVGRILGDVEAVARDARTLAAGAPDTLARVNGLLDRVGGALGTVTETVADLRRIAADVRGVSAEVPELLADVETEIRRLDDIVVELRQSFPLDAYVEPPAGTAVDVGAREAP